MAVSSLFRVVVVVVVAAAAAVVVVVVVVVIFIIVVVVIVVLVVVVPAHVMEESPPLSFVTDLQESQAASSAAPTSPKDSISTSSDRQFIYGDTCQYYIREINWRLLNH